MLTGRADRAEAFSRSRIPMARFGSLGEDGPLLLLASDVGSYINGQVVVVDGGASLI